MNQQDRIEQLEKGLADCLELAEDLFIYACQSWEWKYGDIWQKELDKARAALRKKEG